MLIIKFHFLITYGARLLELFSSPTLLRCLTDLLNAKHFRNSGSWPVIYNIEAPSTCYTSAMIKALILTCYSCTQFKTPQNVKPAIKIFYILSAKCWPPALDDANNQLIVDLGEVPGQSPGTSVRQLSSCWCRGSPD